MAAEPAPPYAWTRAQRRLHWWTAVLVATGFALGWIMVAVPLRDLLTKFLLFQLHKTLGLIVLGFALWRLALRTRHRRPAMDPGLAPWERRAARSGHAALYALLLVVPLLGYLAASTAPGGVPTLFLGVIPIPGLLAPNPAWYAVLRPVHRAAAIALVALATGHALAALRHHRRGLAVLTRMWRG